MLVDIFVTTVRRPDLFFASMNSFIENTKRDLYRLTVMHDGRDKETQYFIDMYTEQGIIDHSLVHRENAGLGVSINQIMNYIKATNDYYDHPTHGDPSQVTQYLCYNQDDLIYTKNWLETLLKFFSLYENKHKLGFVSGLSNVEHKQKAQIGLTPEGNKIILKDWIRAAQMLAKRKYWESMLPIPRLDPETGRVRAKPDKGIGAGDDWHFIRNHDNSVCKTGRTCMVIEGLVKHIGFDKSTWFTGQSLPETPEDLAEILSFRKR